MGIYVTDTKRVPPKVVTQTSQDLIPVLLDQEKEAICITQCVISYTFVQRLNICRIWGAKIDFNMIFEFGFGLNPKASL